MKMPVLFARKNLCFQLLIFVVVALVFAATQTVEEDVCKEAESCPNNSNAPASVPRDCQLVMASSTQRRQGWGVFTLTDQKRGRPLLFGDLVIQITDLDDNPKIQKLQQSYWKSAEQTGGFYEGRHVVSATPGIGMLALSSSNGSSNVLPFVPTVDEGGLTRQTSPGAGAITHYHNFSYFVQYDLGAGDEVFVPYSRPEEFPERNQEKIVSKTGEAVDVSEQSTSRSVEWLRKHGRCLDNIRPGRSNIKDAGRGAFATRFLPQGSIVAPVPVVAITDRRLLDIGKERKGLKQQLLLNYCLGHGDSSVLLYPYGPGVNLINHGGGKHANVKLQWSTMQQDPITANVSLADLQQQQQPATFLLELVALRDINKYEEILLDYGTDWIEAWLRHLETWEPFSSQEGSYAPSYVQDDVVKALRTEEELKSFPYPDNVFTSCFYRYSDHKDQHKQSTDTVTTIRWNQTRGIYELDNLRPCTILKRQQDPKLGTVFTVQIRNRFGLSAQERLPKGAIHIVTHVPRGAIRFSDKMYTTDQHLANAFRHEIRVPDDLFPEQWKDLVVGKEEKEL